VEEQPQAWLRLHDQIVGLFCLYIGSLLTLVRTYHRHGYGFMIKGEHSYEGIWVYDEAGEEGAPIWEPYLELDASILQERVREQVRGMCSVLALPYGSIEIVCNLVPSEQLLSLLKGALKPLLSELTALQVYVYVHTHTHTHTHTLELTQAPPH